MRIRCYGDSNTWGFDPRSYFGGRYPAESRWVDLLARELGCECLNLGENGRRIPLREAPPDPGGGLLIVQLGVNDLLSGLDAGEAARRMEAFLARGSGLRLLVSPPPLSPGSWVASAGLIEASRALGPLYGRAAARCGILFAGSEAWGVETAFDGVHFSEEGHRRFAAGLAAYLRSVPELGAALEKRG